MPHTQLFKFSFFSQLFFIVTNFVSTNKSKLKFKKHLEKYIFCDVKKNTYKKN